MKKTTTQERIESIKKYYPECAKGHHIPVAYVNESDEITEVFCQECGVPMTKEQHEIFFSFFKYKYPKGAK